MSRRALDFRTIEEVVAELDRLQAGSYQKGGNWDLAQVCNHLAIFVRGSLDGFTTPKPPWYVRLIAPLFVRWMLWKRWMPERVKIPPALQPQPNADETKEVQGLMQLLLRFKEHRGPLYPSPFAGDFRYDTWREIHLIHCAHHLSFLHPAALTAAATGK